MRVDLLLHFCDFVKVLNANTPSDVLSRLIRTFLESGSLFNEPRCGRGLYHEFEASVNVSLKDNAHGNFSVILTGAIIEFFAELHHVDTEGTECLTDLRRRLSDTCVYIQTN
jgi:hypothetical protein